MKNSFLLFFAALMALCSCGSKSSSGSADSAQSAPSDSAIIIYFSQTGATKSVAEELQRQLGCAIAAIEPVKPYDGDYPATIARWLEEVRDSVKVEIKPLDINLDKYSTIFLGFPIWGGNYALPVASFLADYPLDGKKIVTFATFGSGGVEAASANIAALLPSATVIPGYGVRNARIAAAPAEITRFLVENGFIEGQITPLPEYSGLADVTPEEAEVFHKACDNYQFPLGTPVKVASRSLPGANGGMDYRFEAVSSAPDGSSTSSTIYVIASDDSAPEFTRVVRH